jgi:transposase
MDTALLLTLILRVGRVRAITGLRHTEPWSNGQTEGQINRLKALKRTMYGRAGPELLRARLLPV